MSNLLKAEFYKLFHSWYFWGIGLFNLLLSSVLLLDSVGETSNLFFASIYNMPILYFLTIIFSALFVGNDFGRRTLQSYINAGHRRGKILFAKLVVHQIACMVILSFPLLLHSIIGTFVTKGALASIGIVVMVIASQFAMCLLPFFFAFIFRDIGKSMAVPMVLFFLMVFLMNGDQAQLISQILPMGQLRLMALQQSNISGGQFMFSDFLWVLALCLGIFIIENPIDSKVEIDPNRLFERFYTGDKSRHNSGTGVGLAVVKLLTDKLGGNVFAKIENDTLTISLEIK